MRNLKSNVEETCKLSRLRNPLMVELSNSLQNELNADIEIWCEDGRIFSAHRLVLAASSSFLCKVLAGNTNQVLILPDVGQASVHHLLNFIYNGTINTTYENGTQVLDLAQRLGIDVPTRKRKRSASPNSPTLQPSSKKARTTFDKSFRDGGFTEVFLEGRAKQSQAFIFPSNPSRQSARDGFLKQITQKLHNVCSPEKEKKTTDVLKRICKIDKKETKKKSEPVSTSNEKWVESLKKNFKTLPEPSEKPKKSQNKTRKSQGRIAQIGPKIPTLETIYEVLNNHDTIRVIRYVRLTDLRARYVRRHSILGLAPEKSVKAELKKLRGNGGSGFIETKQLDYPKWYREAKKESEAIKTLGEIPRVKFSIGFVPSHQLKEVLQHFVTKLNETNQIQDIEEMNYSPGWLHGKLVLIFMEDAGCGYTVGGFRFLNRKRSNSGKKTFCLNMINRSDKALSISQSQAILGISLRGLNSIKSLMVNGNNVDLVCIKTGDFEALSNETGHVGSAATQPSYCCDILLKDLRKHSEKEEPHNFKTVHCKPRTAKSCEDHFSNQVIKQGFTSIEEFEAKVDMTQENSFERKFRDNSKHFGSIISKDVTGCEIVIGGGLHMLIGIVNDDYKDLMKELGEAGLSSIAAEIKIFVENSQKEGGLGCTPSKEHGGDLNGNDSYQFILHEEEIIEKIPVIWIRRLDWHLKMKTEKLIFKTLGKAEFLPLEEKISLGQNIENLSSVIHLRFPRSITTKMHFLLVHTFPIVEKYNTYGLINEQSIEALHQVLKEDERRFLHLNKRPQFKLKSKMEHHNIGALLDNE